MKVLKIIFTFILALFCIAFVPFLMGMFNVLLKLVLQYLKWDAEVLVTVLFGLYVVWEIIKEFFKYVAETVKEKS